MLVYLRILQPQDDSVTVDVTVSSGEGVSGGGCVVSG